MSTIVEELKAFNTLQPKYKDLGLPSRLEENNKTLENLQKQASAANFWDDVTNAQTVSSEIGDIEKENEQIHKLQNLYNDLSFLTTEINKGEEAFAEDFITYLREFEKQLEAFKVKVFLNGKYDKNDVVFSIFAGQGGTEANDWADMLLRMYLRYFASKEWQATVIEKTAGTEAGISSVSIKVSGRYAYGHCKVEHGTHRLVRISPYNAQGLRQTSFAGVEVTPIIKDDDEIKINPEEIEFTAVRSSGAGGQNVNKVATAVRIRHIPSGIIVTCSSERSQLQNKETAMEILRSKLALKAEEERQAQIASAKGKQFQASWGNQIRNYVLHPYKLVKDLRTKVETDKVEAVLDGDLEKFISAGIIYLA